MTKTPKAKRPKGKKKHRAQYTRNTGRDSPPTTGQTIMHREGTKEHKEYIYKT